MVDKPERATDSTDDFGASRRQTAPGTEVNRFEALPTDGDGNTEMRCAFGGKRDLLRFGPANSRQVWHRVGGEWRELSEAAVQRLLNQLTEAARNATWDDGASDGAEKYQQVLELIAATFGKRCADLDNGFSALKQ